MKLPHSTDEALHIALTYGIPLAIVVGSYILGFLFKRYLFSRLEKMAEKSSWEGDDLIVNMAGGMVVPWFFLVGCLFAVPLFPMPEDLRVVMLKVVKVLLIVSFSWIAASVGAGLTQIYSRRFSIPSSSIFINITRILILILGVLIALQSVGISITPMLTALGVSGLAVALALQDTLSNLFAGIHLLMSGQIRVGDYVSLSSGEEGYVSDITWRNTTLRQMGNNLVVVPNSKLSSAIIINYSLPDPLLSVIVQVGVAYDSDLEKVERVTTEVAKAVMDSYDLDVETFPPFIRYHTFGDSSINFSVIMKSKEFGDKFALRHDFIKALHKRYQEEGIEIPFPIRTVYLNEAAKES
jgi:small-conductance mechanosensitive channel